MKNFNRDSLRLYAVTDRSWLGEQTLCEQVEEALRGGATMVQIFDGNNVDEFVTITVFSGNKSAIFL